MPSDSKSEGSITRNAARAGASPLGPPGNLPGNLRKGDSSGNSGEQHRNHRQIPSRGFIDEVAHLLLFAGNQAMLAYQHRSRAYYLYDNFQLVSPGAGPTSAPVRPAAFAAAASPLAPGYALFMPLWLRQTL